MFDNAKEEKARHVAETWKLSQESTSIVLFQI